MFTKHFHIIVVLLLFSYAVIGQVGVQSIPKSSQTIVPTATFTLTTTFQVTNALDKYYQLGGEDQAIAMQIDQAPLGLFCKLDKSMDQKLPMKLRFRLGEYHYTNGLEYGDELGRRIPTEPIENH